ncbi:MAG: MraY family glycosyltransferase [Planctomycetota bacterium]
MIVEATSCGLGTVAVLLIVLWGYRQGRNVLPEDCPRPGRKRHGRPPPMAGIIPCLAAAIWFGVAGHPVLAGAVLVAGATGFGDDLRKARHDGLGWRTKACGLIGASALVVHGTLGIDAVPLEVCAAFVAATFVCINATNFLDNMHGVATSVAVVGLALTAAGGREEALPLAAIWLAFLPFNWPHGRAFLGDAGAYALGTSLAAMAVLAADGRPLAALAPTAVLWLDFVQVVSARLYLGYAPWIGDRRHLSHLLLGAGVPLPLVAPVLAAVALAAGLAIPILAPAD